MDQRPAARRQLALHRGEEGTIGIPPHMLEHADADNAVIGLRMAIGMNAVIHKQELRRAVPVAVARAGDGDLVFRKGDAGDGARAGFTGDNAARLPPAATDIEDTVPGLDAEPRDGRADLAQLRVAQGHFRRVEKGAGINEAFVEKGLVKIIADIVMRPHVILVRGGVAFALLQTFF